MRLYHVNLIMWWWWWWWFSVSNSKGWQWYLEELYHLQISLCSDLRRRQQLTSVRRLLQSGIGICLWSCCIQPQKPYWSRMTSSQYRMTMESACISYWCINSTKCRYFILVPSRFAETVTLTLSLTLISANRVSANRKDTVILREHLPRSHTARQRWMP